MRAVLMGKGNDPSLWSRTRLVCGCVVSLAALAVAACGAAVVPGSVADHPSATATTLTTQGSTHTRAEDELGMLLASGRVPSAAVEVASPPLAYLAQPSLTEGSPNFLIRTSWWRIDMSFADTLEWIQAHPPRGSKSGSGGQAGGPGVPVNRVLGFSVPSTTAYDGAQVELELVAVSSSETALRADAEVIWLPAKPTSEFVPTGSAITLVAINHFGSPDATTLRTKHIDTADAAVMVHDLNALLPSDGGSHGCAADEGYRVQIEVTVASTPMVFSDFWACNLIQVTRGGTGLLTLSPTEAFEDEVTRQIGPPPSF